MALRKLRSLLNLIVSNKDCLSVAEWLDERRVLRYARFLCGAYALAAILWIGLSPGLVDPRNRPIGTDFMSFWAAGKLARESNPADAYDYSRHFAVERQALRWHNDYDLMYFPWHYPPTFLLVASLLAIFPYGASLALWTAISITAYLMAVRSVLPYRRWLLVALAFPAAFVNLGHGQNGFVSVALLGGGLLLLECNAVVAGILFGLMSYKPQLGILLPLVLMVSGHWRAFLSAAATTIGLACVSFFSFGVATWRAFIASISLTRGLMLEQGAAGWEKLQSVFSAVRTLGGGIEVAYVVQAIVTFVVAIVAVWMWRKPVSVQSKGAVLTTASLLATPYVLDYDLILLVLPVAWLMASAMETGFLEWERIGLFVACFLPFISRPLGNFHIIITPVVLGFLLLLIVRRILFSVSSPARKSVRT